MKCNYKLIYSFLLAISKIIQWKVIESYIKENGTEAYILPTSRRIFVEKRLSYKRKCIALSHELIGHAHQIDSKNKKWKKFFNNKKFKKNKKNLNYIESAEVNASRRAAKFLKSIGFKNANKHFEELNKKDLKEWLRQAWIEDFMV